MWQLVLHDAVCYFTHYISSLPMGFLLTMNRVYFPPCIVANHEYWFILVNTYAIHGGINIMNIEHMPLYVYLCNKWITFWTRNLCLIFLAFGCSFWSFIFFDVSCFTLVLGLLLQFGVISLLVLKGMLVSFDTFLSLLELFIHFSVNSCKFFFQNLFQHFVKWL